MKWMSTQYPLLTPDYERKTMNEEPNIMKRITGLMIFIFLSLLPALQAQTIHLETVINPDDIKVHRIEQEEGPRGNIRDIHIA